MSLIFHGGSFSMKRKIALILAGCLAISPVSAGLYTTQAFAAETDTISEISEATQQTPLVIVVKDENDVALTESEKETEAEKYIVKVGETRRLTAFIEQGSDSPVLSEWSSDTPEIISIDDEGVITAQSAGVGKISLNISADAEQNPLLIKFEIIVIPEEEETSEINADETAAASASAETVAEMPQAKEAEVTEETVEITEGAEADAAAETVEIAEDAEADAAAETAKIAEGAEADAAAVETTDPAAEATTTDPAAAVETTDPATAATTTDPATAVEATDPAAEATTTAPAAAVETTDPAAETATTAPATAVEATDPAATAEMTGTISVDAATVTANADAKVNSQSGSAKVVKPHWEGSGSNWSYIKSDGSKATGLLTLGSRTFFLNNSGRLRYGWIGFENNLYFADSDGALVTGWLKRGSKYFYFRDDHTMVTGKATIGNKTYFFTQNGVRRTGWVRYGGSLYYTGSNGDMRTGWQTINGKRFLFLSNGKMKTGWFTVGSRRYYLAANGRQKTGFTRVDGITYYLRQDGYATKGWKKFGRYWFYFKNSRVQTGWLELGSKKYYFDSNGRMATGTRTIDGKRYEFGSDGSLVVNNYTYNNPQEFIDCIAPLVKKYAPAWGVKVYSPIIAQAILESASGESSLGKVYNNYFGLKCGTLWKGKSVNLRTGEEYTPGTYTTISANFRVYDNMEEGVEGYFIFLFKNRTRYNNLIGETDPYDYLVKIKEDGYATSTHYVQNVYNVIKHYNLTRFDD